jgi:hypothetical protein
MNAKKKARLLIEEPGFYLGPFPEGNTLLGRPLSKPPVLRHRRQPGALLRTHHDLPYRVLEEGHEDAQGSLRCDQDGTEARP